MIAHAQQMLRADSEDRSPIAAAIEASVTDWFHGRSEPVEAVVISDYGKGVVSERLAAKVIAEANRRGAPVVVDSKARDFGRYRGAAVVTPNQHDAARAARMPIESDEDLAIAAEQLSGDSGGAAILVTRGADGMTLFSDRGSMHVAAEARDVFDVTGAGDTVVAVLAVALARGVQLEDAVRLANTAAGIVVSKIGTSTVSLDELERGT
jgi:D-beta-D-heptose 7-phosphate kinase/D-beta-D-heptose 1-phosphate adenosyltransferase